MPSIRSRALALSYCRGPQRRSQRQRAGPEEILRHGATSTSKSRSATHGRLGESASSYETRSARLKPPHFKMAQRPGRYQYGKTTSITLLMMSDERRRRSR